MATAFGAELRRLRAGRGWSQMQLALETDISTRHLSFLETGRGRPSRAMVLRLGGALDLPYRVQNDLLVSAGFAPAYGNTSLGDPLMARISDGLEFLLESHEPYPAFVLDRSWNIVMSNHPHRSLLGRLLRQTGASVAEPENALRLVLAPDRLRPAIRNWTRVVRALMLRLERQVRLSGGDQEVKNLRDEMMAYEGVGDALGASSTFEEVPILLPLELSLGSVVLSWYSTIASLGAAFDVTTQEIVIESLLPADPETKRLAHELAQTAEAPTKADSDGAD